MAKRLHAFMGGERRGGHTAKHGFWGTMFDYKFEKAWSGGQMALLIIGSLILGLFGAIMGILGLCNKARRVQGGVLLVIGVLGMLFGAAVGTSAVQAPGGRSGGYQTRDSRSTRQPAEYEIRQEKPGYGSSRRDIDSRAALRMMQEAVRQRALRGPSRIGGSRQPTTCSFCKGTGNSSLPCASCNGTGMSGSFACSFCNGRRFEQCMNCKGTGRR